ncbi:MAG: Ig-like domain-containing protein [Rhodothermales bacterium]
MLRFIGFDGTLRVTGGGGVTVAGGTLDIESALDNAGELSVESSAMLSLEGVLANSGTLGGSGTLTVSNATLFTNTGTVAPGLSAAVAILPVGIPSGSLPFGPDGRLEVELGGLEPGTGYDRLAVGGAVALGGELALSVLDGFTPELGQTFEVLTFTSSTGDFDAYTGTSLGNGTGLAPSFTETSLVLTVVPDGNNPPIANADTASTPAGVPVLIDVLANDTDPDGDALLLAGVRPPANGTAEVADDAVRYTPSAGFAGTDSFTYTVSDGNGGADTDTVTVTVIPAPNVPPVAVDDAAAVAVNGTVLIDVLANDSDEDGDALVLEGVEPPVNGTGEVADGEVRYTPNSGFEGTDSFTYAVGDGNGGFDVATVTVVVTDLPYVLTGPEPGAQMGVDDDIEIYVGQVPVFIDNNGFAGLFGPLAFEAQPGDSLRVVAIDRGICQGLTPFYLTVVATGEQVALDSVGVNYQTGCISGPTIFYDSTFVLPSDPAGNTPPVAVADTAAVAANGSVLIDVLANDFDLDGDTLDLFDTSGPGNGTAEPEGEMVRYTPNAGFVGTDSFTYVVGDGNGGIGMGMVTVTVSSAANTPPVAVDDAAETQAAVTVFIDVLANDSDADGDTLRIEGFTLPENGTAVVAGGLFRYAPRAGFVGTDSFFYTVGDGNGGLDEATVTVTVTEGSGPVPGTCTPGLASADLAVNDVSARLYTTGSLFYDEGSGGQYLVPQASGIAPIFAAGVWIGGQVGGELRTAASTYASGVADPEFWPGPLGDDGRPVDPDDCAAFDRIYSVDRSAITAYESTGVASDDLAGWPVGLGAPAVDADGAPIAATSLDQTLDLEAGERPVLFGSRVSFWVMNDVGNVHTSSGRPPIGLEVRALAFSFDDADAALDQSTLYRYELVNKGGAPLEEARFSLFLDPDVGGALDDYVGSDPARGLGFAYNADADDDLYGSPPPAVGVDLFQGTGSFAYYSNDVGAATGDPTFGVGATYYNYMRGVWSDGTPITEGGTGYRSGGPVTPYAFPGDPEGEAFWSEVNADGAGGDTPPDDRRFVLSAPSFALAPGASQTFDFAILFATGADHLNSVTALKQASDRLQALYDTGDLYREASEEASVEVVAPPQTAAGSGFSVGVAVTGFVPTVAELRYRPVGATGYGSTPLTVSGDGYEGAIPNAAVTLRGVEYYVFLSNGARTITFPADEPETNPLRVRVGVAQQASSVMLPGDASAVTAYRMVSVPLVLDDPSPLAVFGDDYGDYGPTSWRLLRYLPLAERYAEFPDLNAAVVPGAAFWLAAYAEASGSFDVENGLSVDASEPVLLTLAPGWNQIGTPFAFPVAWDAVLGSETDGIQTPDFWDGTQYVERAVLDPWVGYFVLNGTEETVTLRVPPTEAGQTRSATRPAAKEGEEGYRLRLLAEARDRGLRDTQNLLGFADGAAEGRDRLDRAEPPPITTHLRLSAVEDGVRLGRSFRPAGTDGAAWELEVTATPDVLDAGPLAVRVALEEVGGRPDGYDVHVLDLDREVPLTLLESAFELTLSAARPVQRLRLIAGTDGFADAARGGISLAPVAFALAPAYPNPFAGTTTLAYELPEPADVTLDVFDLLGRRVAVLADGVQEAGRYTARWDGTVAGAPAANGVYVYRLRAGGFTASHKMVLLR